MGIKMYNVPCLRRISDLPQGTFFLYNHEMHIIARTKVGSEENDPIIYVVNLENGILDAYPVDTIVSVVYDGSLRISTDMPPKKDGTNDDKFKAIVDAYEFCKGQHCSGCPKRKACNSVFGNTSFVVSQVGSLAKKCSDFNNSSYDE